MDIENPDFWDVDYRWITNEINADGIIHPGSSNLTGQTPYTDLTLSELSSNEVEPNVWTLTDGLAKSFYSSILTDLGQTNASPNILHNETTLQFFTSGFEDMVKHIANAHPGPGNRSYEDSQGLTGPLGTTPSVIATTYSCQVPESRSLGSVILTIFLADLIFVQAVWKLLSLATTSWLMHRHPEANTCQGCRGQPMVLAEMSFQNPRAASISSKSRLLPQADHDDVSSPPSRRPMFSP